MTVRIVETGKHYLKGHLLSDKDIVQPDVPLPLKKGQVSGASGLVQVSRQWSKLIKNKAHLIDKTKIMHFFYLFANKIFYYQILVLPVVVPLNNKAFSCADLYILRNHLNSWGLIFVDFDFFVYSRRCNFVDASVTVSVTNITLSKIYCFRWGFIFVGEGYTQYHENWATKKSHNSTVCKFFPKRVYSQLLKNCLF